TSFTIKKNEMKIDNMINNHKSTWFLNSYTILIANNILNTLAILAAILTNKLFWKFCLPTLLIFFISSIFFLFFDYSTNMNKKTRYTKYIWLINVKLQHVKYF